MPSNDLDAEWQRIRESFVYFLDEYAWYQETRGDEVRGMAKFVPWPWQRDVAYAMQYGDPRPDGKGQLQNLVILKTRQVGVSWLVCLYALHQCLTVPGTNVLAMSRGEDAAKRLNSRIRAAYYKLPEWIKDVFTINKAAGVVEFYVAGQESEFSRIEALPSTEAAGRSEATTLALLDEWAFHPYADENYPAIVDSLGREGRVIGVSTANGPAGAFHNIFSAATRRRNDFASFFLPYNVHPHRDAAWYEVELQNRIEALGEDAGRRAMRQEYPRTWQEAFVSATSAVFDSERLSEMLTLAKDHPPQHVDLQNGYRAWEQPVMGGDYVAGVDCSEGLADGDAHAVVMREWRTGRHVATLHGRWEIRDFARRLYDLGKHWNTAFFGVERNGPGLAVIQELENAGYRRMFYEVRATTNPNNPHIRPGWVTNKTTKPYMIAEMVEAIANGSMLTFDSELLGEYLTYMREEPRVAEIKVSSKAGRMGAMAGKYDDLVMADLICWQMRRHYERPPDQVQPYNAIEGSRLTGEEVKRMLSIRGGSHKLELMRKAGTVLPGPYKAW